MSELTHPSLSGVRAGLVHDWLPVLGGAERVLAALIDVLPQSDVHTLVDFLSDEDRRFLGARHVHTSFIQNLPFARSKYRSYLPLAPLAIEGFDMEDYEMVVSSSYAVAKGVLTTAEQLHVSYVHSPVRYAWDLQFSYLRDGGYTRGPKRMAARALLHYLRLFDLAAAARVDAFVTNSHYVARRVWKTYRRRAAVLHPPVDVEGFALSRDRGDYYVTVSRLVPYKRVDLIVEAFNQMPDRELVVIGSGPDLKRLQRLAGPNVRMLGYQPESAVRHYLGGARAFLFGALEDFGIAPVEAQACGTPVIAYGRGGALETVVPGVSGLFFDEQTPAAVCDAVARFEGETFEPEEARRNAERFSHARFHERASSLLGGALDQFRRTGTVSLPDEELEVTPSGSLVSFPTSD